MIVQILCNNNYSCNQPNSFDTENEGIETSEPLKRIKREKKNTQKNIKMETNTPNQNKVISIEDTSRESFICGQPESYYPSILKKCSLHQPTSFNQDISNTPSFNLNSNKKSTPNRPCQNCKSSNCQTYHPLLTNSLEESQITPNCLTIPRQNVHETQIEIHRNPKNESNSDDAINLC